MVRNECRHGCLANELIPVALALFLPLSFAPSLLRVAPEMLDLRASAQRVSEDRARISAQLEISTSDGDVLSLFLSSDVGKLADSSRRSRSMNCLTCNQLIGSSPGKIRPLITAPGWRRLILENTAICGEGERKTRICPAKVDGRLSRCRNEITARASLRRRGNARIYALARPNDGMRSQVIIIAETERRGEEGGQAPRIRAHPSARGRRLSAVIVRPIDTARGRNYRRRGTRGRGGTVFILI